MVTSRCWGLTCSAGPSFGSRSVTVERLRRRHARVVLDLEEVRAVDFAGLHVLRDLERTVASGGGELLLLIPSIVAGARQ